MDDVRKILKKWEHTFMEENKRKPTGKDISDAPDHIKDGYKKYTSYRKASKAEDEVWGSNLNKKVTRDSESIQIAKPSTVVNHIRQRIYEKFTKNAEIESIKSKTKLSKHSEYSQEETEKDNTNLFDSSLSREPNIPRIKSTPTKKTSVSSRRSLSGSAHRMINNEKRLQEIHDQDEKYSSIGVETQLPTNTSSDVRMSNDSDLEYPRSCIGTYEDIGEFSGECSSSSRNSSKNTYSHNNDENIDKFNGEFNRNSSIDTNEKFQEKFQENNSTPRKITKPFAIVAKQHDVDVHSNVPTTSVDNKHRITGIQTGISNANNVTFNDNDAHLSGGEKIFGKKNNLKLNANKSIVQMNIEKSKELISSPILTTTLKRKHSDDLSSTDNLGYYIGIELTDQQVEMCAPESKRYNTSKKIPKSSTDNGNYVKINLKKKIYTKGGSSMTGSQYKRQRYKELTQPKKRGRPGYRGNNNFQGQTCFKCGREGHWAKNCTGIYKKVEPDSIEPDGKAPSQISVSDSSYLTMNQALKLARGIKNNTETGDEDEEAEELSVIRQQVEIEDAPVSASPIYSLNEDGTTPECPKEVMKYLKVFGFDSFRHGQEKAVMRMLCGQSTLVVLSTGAGKSLCYQLPAYIYARLRPNTLTLVISPLVSLMDDQVKGLPPGVNGACYHGNQNKTQKERVINGLKMGHYQFLLVSPETLVGGSSNALPWLQNDGTEPPEIAFACIDEVHCVSQWSHHFRPSYLRLIRVLREKYGVKCILGLTATATNKTILSIQQSLSIDHDTMGEGIIRGKSIPNNLHLSISRDENKDEALIELLSGGLYSGLTSIVIYCTRRQQTEHVTTLIRTCMQGVKSKLKTEDSIEPFDETTNTINNEDSNEEIILTKKGKPRKKQAKKKVKPKIIDTKPEDEWTADFYHAGQSSAARRRVQTNFMCGKLRIVVATVAFGMGLDKSDIRGIIHYSIPKSYESYVQEIGRAGRDGQDAFCHLFIDKEGKDENELKRHIFGNSVDLSSVRKLIRKIFPECKCHKSKVKSHSKEVCQGHERALPIEKLVNRLDCKEEGLETLLCYLELHEKRWLTMMKHCYSTCTLSCYKGPVQLQEIAKKCPPVAVAIAAEKRRNNESHANTSALTFDLIAVSDIAGWSSAVVRRELRALQWQSNAHNGVEKSGVIVEFSDLSFRVRSRGDYNDDEIHEITDYLKTRLANQEKDEVSRLKSLYETFFRLSHRSIYTCLEVVDEEKSNALKNRIVRYFNQLDEEQSECQQIIEREEDEGNVKCAKIPFRIPMDLGSARGIINSFINEYGSSSEHKLTGRAVARVLHGIQSPCFPAEVWGRLRSYWRVLLDIDFNVVRKLSEQILRRIAE